MWFLKAFYGGWFVPFRIIVFSGRNVWGEQAPRENPQNGEFFVFSHGDLTPRHTKVRHFSCVAFSPPVSRIFAWRGERSPRDNPPKSPFGVFSYGDLSSRQAKIRRTGAKTRKVATQNPPNDDFSCFSMATFRPATRKYATFHALRFRLLLVVSLPGEAKGRKRSPCENPTKSPFATFRVFAPKTRKYKMAQISHHSFPFSNWN